jgi:DNA polymerase IV
MSVLCCRIPDFLIRLHCRRHPGLAALPLALLGGDEQIWALSPAAASCGVLPGMSPRQAQMRCPDLRLYPLDSQEAAGEQGAFLGALHQWGLPVEPLGWGCAYLDLGWLARERHKVEPFCADMGRNLRQALGELLQPSLGWDSGKFTARAAAFQTAPGRMKLVDKSDEVRFLSPLPISLLPLSPAALQQLHWLGIHTLGQYAQLPEVAVWQRFGQAGKLARRWAQGRDDRPIQSAAAQTPEAITVTFDPPEGLFGPVRQALLAALRPALAELAAQLRGLHHLRLQMYFVDGSTRTLDLTFVEAAYQEARLSSLLSHRLETLAWPGEIEEVTLWLLASGEVPIQQATLFPEMAPREDASLAELAHTLQGRFGHIFFQSAVTEASHPVAERRSQWRSLTGAGEPL